MIGKGLSVFIRSVWVAMLKDLLSSISFHPPEPFMWQWPTVAEQELLRREEHVTQVVGAGMSQAKTTFLGAWREQLGLGWGQTVLKKGGSS